MELFDRLITLLHEIAHFLFPKMAEKIVDKTAELIAMNMIPWGLKGLERKGAEFLRLIIRRPKKPSWLKKYEGKVINELSCILKTCANHCTDFFTAVFGLAA